KVIGSWANWQNMKKYPAVSGENPLSINIDGSQATSVYNVVDWRANMMAMAHAILDCRILRFGSPLTSPFAACSPLPAPRSCGIQMIIAAIAMTIHIESDNLYPNPLISASGTLTPLPSPAVKFIVELYMAVMNPI